MPSIELVPAHVLPMAAAVGSVFVGIYLGKKWIANCLGATAGRYRGKAKVPYPL